ncbi:MAG: bifunctional phosphoglucose/phosphomannose isomerase [bacterium]|nr:bifunctional phosphoglucose/phosphomannose isomerase [bacterium]
MNMIDAIKAFPKQFEYKPKVENSERLDKHDKFVVVGMGGSALSGGLLKIFLPGIDVLIHKSYGLPQLSEDDLKQRLVIASSYSGNTEETIDALSQAIKNDLDVAVIASGGKMIELAKENNVPYVVIPDTGIQPRMALGFNLLGLLKLMDFEDFLSSASELSKHLEASASEKQGKELATKMKDHVPIIYGSDDNMAVIYNWKIKFNETGKIPAFFNVVPELNHNEMTGFDTQDSSKHLSEKFYFIFLKDQDDDSRIQKRMKVLQKLYEDRGLPVEVIEMKGSSKLEKVFTSLLLADWAALYIAELYGLEAEQVPMVEEFKKLI